MTLLILIEEGCGKHNKSNDFIDFNLKNFEKHSKNNDFIDFNGFRESWRPWLGAQGTS